MFRVSSLLRNSRLEKQFDLQEISKKLKIPAKYLRALEEDQISAFPQEPYCSLIVKDYAEFLGLNGSEVLRLFHRDYDPKHQPSDQSKKLFSFTPQFTFTLFLLLGVLAFSGFLLYEYLKFNQPPTLKVNWPTEIHEQILEISGTTDPEATVRINDDLVIVDSNGNFKKTIRQETSPAKVIIESKSPAGKITRQEKTL